MTLQAQMMRLRDAVTELLILSCTALRLPRFLDWWELRDWRRAQRRNPS